MTKPTAFRAMRLFSVMSLTLLAACGEKSAPDASVAVPDAIERPVTPVQRSVLETVPVRFVGTWDRDTASCSADRPGEMRLVIEPRRIRFWESEARVDSATEMDAGVVDVEAVTTGEGITEQRQYRLALAEGGALDTTASGTTARRVRCDVPGGQGSGAIALGADGLTLNGTAIAFGNPATQVSAVMDRATGRSARRTAQPECDAGPLAVATYPGLRLWFQDDRFVGWEARGATLATAAGVRIGTTNAELDRAVSVERTESSLGNEFTAGSLTGLTDGTGPDGRVQALWAGTTCTVR